MKYFKSKLRKRVVCSSTNPNPKAFKEITKKEYDAEMEKKAKRIRILELKRLLAKTDYEAIKYAEGEMSAEDYEPYKIQRRAYRSEINELEASL